MAWQLPTINHQTRSIISNKEEILLGNILRYKLLNTGIIMENLLLDEYINRLGASLLINLNQKDFNKFHFFIINNQEINAFAFMGGNIGIFSGLIQITETESELAAILAHEIGHITQKHFAKELIKNQHLLPITIIEAIAAIAVGVPDLIIPILGGHLQQLLNFSRTQEKEADHVGIEILNKSQFNPLAMANIFERMSKLEKNSQQIPEYLLTHPLFESRISDVYQRTRSRAYKQYKNCLDYQLIKKIINLNLTKNKLDLLVTTNKLLELNANQEKTDLLYQQAMLLKDLHQYAKAEKILQQLTKTHPENLIIQTSLAELLLILDPKKARIKLEYLYQIAPDYLPIIVNYAKTLLHLNLPLEVQKILEPFNKDHLNELSEETKIYELLIASYQKLNAKSEVLLTQAKLLIINNQFNASQEKLELAVKIASKLNNQQTLNKIIKLKNELEEFKDTINTIKF